MNIEREISDFLSQYTDNGAYWYPLCILKRPIPVIAYYIDKIYKDRNIRTAYSFQFQSAHSELVEKDAEKYPNCRL